MTRTTKSKLPTPQAIVNETAAHVYGQRVLNNAHRGDIVETMVWMALGEHWQRVGLGWHPWDLQRGEGVARVRIQIKQTAKAQLWGDTVTRSVAFGWKSSPPSYFEEYNPGESIESEGYFCEIFVIGVHDGTDRGNINQADPAEWSYLVIPASDLEPRTNSMILHRVQKKWPPVTWERLKQSVEKACKT